MKKILLFLIFSFWLYQGAFATTIPTSGLIGRWDLTSNATDTSVTALTGTTAYPSYYTGVTFGSEGAVFNGTNGKIFVSTHNPSSYQLSTSQSFSISAWIKTNSVTNSAYYLDNRIFQLNSYTNNVEWNIWFWVSAWKIKTFFRDSNGNLLNPVSTASVNDGLWNQVTLVYDWWTKTLSIYINGNFDNSQTNSSMNGVFWGWGLWTDYANGRNYPTTIWFWQNGSDVWFFDGNIQQVLVYNRAISSGEVADIMLAPLWGGGSTGSGSCYVHDVESGKTLLPFQYNGTSSSDVDSIFWSEAIHSFRSGFAWYDFFSTGYRIYNWYVYINQESYTGSMMEVLAHNSGSYVQYRSSKPTIEFELYPWISFGDVDTTSFESSGSNAINYIRLVTDKWWHLEAKIIKNIGSSSFPDNVEDSNYTRFDSFSGAVYLSLGQVTRKFKIVFDNLSPVIFSIDWGSYTRTVSSSTVCTPWLVKINTYVNWQVTTATWQAVFVTDLTNALSTAIINQSGSIVQSEFECPKDITDLSVPWLSFVSWGFSQHIPIIDYTIDVKPFGMLECPLKSIYLFTSKFQ